MATTERTGRPIHNLANEVLILPQGGLPDPAPEGAIVLEDGNLYIWTLGEWYKVTMTQADSGISADSNAKVSNAGTAAANGTYVNNGTRWDKGGPTAFSIQRITGYPTPGVTSWAIMSEANVFYTAPDCPFPWDAVWAVSSFGVAPVPTVVGLPKVETRKSASKSGK